MPRAGFQDGWTGRSQCDGGIWPCANQSLLGASALMPIANLITARTKSARLETPKRSMNSHLYDAHRDLVAWLQNEEYLWRQAKVW
jgi:hypothetical protein